MYNYSCICILFVAHQAAWAAYYQACAQAQAQAGLQGSLLVIGSPGPSLGNDP